MEKSLIKNKMIKRDDDEHKFNLQNNVSCNQQGALMEEVQDDWEPMSDISLQKTK